MYVSSLYSIPRLNICKISGAGKGMSLSIVPTIDKQYPEPQTSHDEVVKSSALFWDSLKTFHTAMSTKFMVPIIGGMELDLHVLYVEVTSRGGYDKVVLDKKWREISSKFSFSPTTTSASYALRKHYYSFLYHYEQVYFSKLQGSIIAPTAPVIFEATGTIDAKTDYCYLVSVKLGSETLNGVLYHPKQPSSAELIKPPGNADVLHDPHEKRSRRKERKRRKASEDPSRPKPNRSGYNFYFAERHSVLKSMHPEKEREFTKMIGESWTNLSQEEKKVYNEIGVKDKERYQKELREYKEKLKDKEVGTNRRDGH